MEIVGTENIAIRLDSVTSQTEVKLLCLDLYLVQIIQLNVPNVAMGYGIY